MNECLFALQSGLVIGCTWIAGRLGYQGLAVWVCLQAIIANLFILKEISLFGLQVTASDPFALGSFFGFQLLQERFGRDMAQNALWSCLFSMTFFAAASQLHLLYIPSRGDTAHDAFVLLLSPSLRLLLASLVAFFTVQYCSLYFNQWLYNRCSVLKMTTRSALGLAFSQLFDTLLFSFLGLYGLVNSIGDVLIMSLTLKSLSLLCALPFIGLGKEAVSAQER